MAFHLDGPDHLKGNNMSSYGTDKDDNPVFPDPEVVVPEVEDEPEPVGEGSDNPDEAPDGC